MIRFHVALVTLGFVACASSATQRTPTNTTDTDAGAITDKDSSVTFRDAGLSGQCERTIGAKTITVSNSECYVNTKVRNQSGDLQYPCAGGPAKIDLGGQLFEGYVTNDTVDLTNVEDFVFEGCNWQSTQKIKGDLGTNSVSYTYSETPLQACPGQYACVANGQLGVTAGAVHQIN